MADSTKLEPITLPQWPSCTDCLVSSEDDLAIASGENVHILTPRGKASAKDPGPHAHWHNSTIRVNQFSEDEWPYQTHSDLEQFSIGEEQSESLVTSLAWSPSGLGLHKRSVLAVLTSNLVLSLWETDGTLGQYRRTCVLNNFLPSKAQHQHKTGIDKPLYRVRAFTWTESLKHDDIFKYGQNYMLVANGAGDLVVLRVTKKSFSQYGNWSIQILSQASLADIPRSQPDLSSLSPLQRRLYQSIIVSKIRCDYWQHSPSVTGLTEANKKKRTAQVEVTAGQLTYGVQLIASPSNSNNRESMINDWEVSFSVADDQGTEQGAQLHPPGHILHSIDELFEPPKRFRSAIKSLTKAFNHQHGLGGYFRVKFWGTCQILGDSRDAICITIHPTDMIEHTQPSVEKCIVVFAVSDRKTVSKRFEEVSDLEVRKMIVQYALSQVQDTNCVPTVLDKRVLNIMAAVCRTLPDASMSSHTFETAVKSVMEDGTNPSIDRVASEGHEVTSIPTGDGSSNTTLQIPTSERCEICSSEIPFSIDDMCARCTVGHEFTRCHMSFLAIQEPGISKYCSGCGRQFLDMVKLDIASGSKFARALFDHFDVCPYCGAKFRG